MGKITCAQKSGMGPCSNENHSYRVCLSVYKNINAFVFLYNVMSHLSSSFFMSYIQFSKKDLETVDREHIEKSEERKDNEKDNGNHDQPHP